MKVWFVSIFAVLLSLSAQADPSANNPDSSKVLFSAEAPAPNINQLSTGIMLEPGVYRDVRGQRDGGLIDQGVTVTNQNGSTISMSVSVKYQGLFDGGNFQLECVGTSCRVVSCDSYASLHCYRNSIEIISPTEFSFNGWNMRKISSTICRCSGYQVDCARSPSKRTTTCTTYNGDGSISNENNGNIIAH